MLAVGLSSILASKANDDSVVHLTGAETISGIKTFSNGFTVSGGTITLPTNSIPSSALNNTTLVDLSDNQTISGTKTFNNYQIVERMAEQVHNAGSGSALSLSYASIKGIVFYSPSANYTLTLTNVPITSSNMTYTLTLIYNTKFYANAITVNGTSYTMRAIGGLSNITINTSALTVMQQINILFLNSSTPIITTSVASLF
jgi:hypothetical protein